MYDEIMQELWPKFEKELKKYSECGPFLAKVGYKEAKTEAIKRLKRYAKLAKKERNPEEFKRLVFRELAILIYMLHHVGTIHKSGCQCSYCNLFRKLLRTFHQESKRGRSVFFFDTGKDFDGDVGFRLNELA